MLICDLEKLDKSFRPFVDEFLNELILEGIQYYINETYRNNEVQNAYYAQGRQSLSEVNSLRRKAGLWLISESENKHTITNAVLSKHQLGLAIDICPSINGRPYWNASDDKWKKIADISVACGLRAGYYFRGFKDSPHHEMK